MRIISCIIFSLIMASTLEAQTVSDLQLNHDYFIENRGQITDQHGLVNSNVKFIYADELFNLQLKPMGFSYELFEVRREETSYESGQAMSSGYNLENISHPEQQLRSHRIDVNFIGANPSVEIFAKNSSRTYFNYYTSEASDVTLVPGYHQILYKNIYPGIDVVFSAKGGDSVKYEWMVHPGADPSKIKLQYSGATAIVESENGGYQIITPNGRIDESKLIAFTADTHLPVEARYQFEDNLISYKMKRNNSKTIVIDPNIVWSTYYGGNLDEDINNGQLAIDGQGKSIIAGSTNSTLNIASTGAFQTNYGGGYHDAFLAKFTANGKLDWATYYGGDEKDEGHALVTDVSNNIILGGLTTSHSGMSTSGSHQFAFAGQQDAFVAKFNSSGVRIWATYFGGTYQDEILDLDCDALGNIYYTGYTISPDKISTPGAYQESLNNSGGTYGDAFLGEFTPAGSLVWGSYLSGPLQDRAHGIAIGEKGELFIQGTCESTTDFASTTGVYQSIYGGGGTDAFLAKWDTNGAFIWCSYFGGPTDDHGRGVRVDAAGNAYIMGWTDSESAIATPGAVQQFWAEDYEIDGDRKPDGFLAKFNENGGIVWSTYYGGHGKEQIFGLALDEQNGLLYAGGYSTSMDNISTPGSYQEIYSGNSDGFITKFNLSGDRIWGSYLNGPNIEEVHGLALYPNGYLSIFLSTEGGNFSITPGTYQLYSKGGDETVLLKFNAANECFDSYEPNNSSSAAKLIKPFADVNLYGYTGAIATSTDVDWYKVKLINQNFQLILTDLPADYDLKLYKSNGQLLIASTNPGTADEMIVYNNIPDATYLIEVSHSATAYDPNNCYRLKPVSTNIPWLKNEFSSNFVTDPEFLYMSIYPNPCRDIIHSKVTALKPGKVTYTLYNMFHQPLVSSSFEVVEGTQEFDWSLERVSSGIYLLELEQNGEKLVKTLAVQ